MGDLFRARLQATPPASQCCARRMLTHLIPETVDLDIENAMFTLLYQIVLALKTEFPREQLETHRRCAQERDSVIQTELRTTRSRGKEILNKVMNGGSPPEEIKGSPFCVMLQSLAVLLQWVAVDLLPDVYDRCQRERKAHPEASTFFYLWSAAEDYVMQAWLERLRQFNFAHVSLHYDGVRVSAPLPTPVDSFCSSCAEAILKRTKFNVCIRQKEHLTFVQSLPLRAERRSRDLPPRQGPPAQGKLRARSHGSSCPPSRGCSA